ncbi:MAG: VWA domain-containing protein [Candidatus Aminicenantes bacterium]|nr:VWA domain-containing protein [Candidatus Aminicenantes bacterium]
MAKKRFIPLLLFAGILLFGRTADPRSSGGQASGQDTALPRFKQEVNVFFKLIQVTVVDKKGNPVSDLTADEFEVSDDGKAQKVEHFELQRPDGPPPGGPGGTTMADPRLSRSFFLLFNYAFIEPNGIAKAKRAALDFLDNYARPTDELGIITFSMAQGLRVNEFLTRDHARIRKMLDGAGTKTVLGRAEQLAPLVLRGVNQFTDFSAETQAAGAAVGEDVAREMIRELTAAETKNRLTNYNQTVSVFLNSLRGLAVGLRYLPGNKNLILFSSGIAGTSLFGAPTVNMPDNLNTHEAIIQWQDGLAVRDGDSRLREFFQKVNEELRAANCPVYAFNVSGPQLTNDVEGFQSQEENTMGIKVRDTVGNDSLKVMASETGGQYFSHTMDLKEAVRKLQNATHTYYVLGYSLPAVTDGKFHKVKVKVKRKGCEVIGEGGYYNPKPFSQYTAFEKLVGVLDLAEGRTPYLQEGIDVRMAAYPVPAKDKLAVAVFAPLPAGRFKSLGQGPAEVVIFLANDRNKVTFYKKTPLYAAALTEETLFFDLAAGLPPGAYDCRLVVRSLETGRGASASAKVVLPPKLDKPGLVLYPANLFVPGARPRFQGDTGALASLYPFSVTGTPLVEGLAPGTPKLIALLSCAVSGIEDPDLALSVSMTNNRTKDIVPVAASVVNRYRGADVITLFVDVPLPALAAGPYTLMAEVLEKTTGAKSQAATDFIAK